MITGVFFGLAWIGGVVVYALLAGEVREVPELVMDLWIFVIPAAAGFIPTMLFLKRKPAASRAYALPLWGGMLGFFLALVTVYGYSKIWFALVHASGHIWSGSPKRTALLISVPTVYIVTGVIFGSYLFWARRSATDE